MFDLNIKHYQIRPEVFDNPILRTQIKFMRLFGYFIGTDQRHQLLHFSRCMIFNITFVGSTVLLFIKIFRSLDKWTSNGISWATTFFSLATSIAVVNLYFQRKRVFTLVNFIHDDLNLLLCRSDEEEQLILETHVKNLRNMTFLLSATAFVSCSVASLDCFIRSIWYPETVFNMPEVLNGTAQPVLLLRIFPFGEVHDDYFTGRFMPYYAIILACSTLPMLHTFSVCLMEFVLIKVDILSKRLRLMDLSKIHKSITNDEDIQRLAEDEKNYWRMKMCAVSVKEQAKVRWFTEELRQFLQIPVLSDVIIFSLILCFLLYVLVNGNPSNMDCFFTFMYLFAISVILWLYHWPATLMSECMDNLCYAIYCCDWYNYPLPVQKSIRLLMISAARPLNMHAIFVTLNLSTFIEIIKGSFSYFSILRNLNADN